MEKAQIIEKAEFFFLNNKNKDTVHVLSNCGHCYESKQYADEFATRQQEAVVVVTREEVAEFKAQQLIDQEEAKKEAQRLAKEEADKKEKQAVAKKKAESERKAKEEATKKEEVKDGDA